VKKNILSVINAKCNYKDYVFLEEEKKEIDERIDILDKLLKNRGRVPHHCDW